MNRDPDRLYDLLPPVYRDRDVAQGYALRGLLRVIAEQADAVEGDIEAMYDNWFIETCASWVVPYLGDLIGYQAVHSAGDPSGAEPAADEGATILVPRREVANTIRFRRRKGTLPVLQQVAHAVTGWPTWAVEFAQYLGVTQPMAHPQPKRGLLVNLRDRDALALLGTPFDEAARRPDLRGPGPSRGGRSNLPDVGVFVWRSKVYHVGRTSAVRVKEVDSKTPRAVRYAFDARGIETPLYTGPNQGTEGALALPEPIRRHAFEEHDPKRPGEAHEEHDPKRLGVPHQASGDYYGVDRSVFIWSNHADHKIDAPLEVKQIVSANLRDAGYVPPPGQVAVDPELGLIAFPTDIRPDRVLVEYHYAFPMDLGGGEYERALPKADPVRVTTQEEFDRALGAEPAELSTEWVIEFATSGTYKVGTGFEVDLGRRLTLRAANRIRAVIDVAGGTLRFGVKAAVTAPSGSKPGPCRLVLDGLLVMGGAVWVETGFSEILLRHCTLVPGLTLGLHLEPLQHDEPSLVLAAPAATVRIDHCILGFTQVVHGPAPHDPSRVVIADSILDATDSERPALRARDCGPAHARLTVARSTVRGSVSVHALDSAQDSIFDGKVIVARRQEGCVRFCYVRPDAASRTPRRFECQPDLVVRDLPPNSDEAASKAARVRPRFESTRYGSPAYCRLAQDCAKEIRLGAEDESEIGVYHDLLEPQKMANLRTRLDEFTPAALRAVAILAT